MKRTHASTRLLGLTVAPVGCAWNVIQAQLADAARWSSAQWVQARAWTEAVNCSASECAKRLLAMKKGA